MGYLRRTGNSRAQPLRQTRGLAAVALLYMFLSSLAQLHGETFTTPSSARRSQITKLNADVSVSEAPPSISAAEVKTPRKPIADFKVGDKVKGTVINRSRFGVFVDIGAKKNALLPIDYPNHNVFRLNRAEELESLKVTKVDVENQRLALELENLESLVEGRPKLRKQNPSSQSIVEWIEEIEQTTKSAASSADLTLAAGVDKDGQTRVKLMGGKVVKGKQTLQLEGFSIESVDAEKGTMTLVPKEAKEEEVVESNPFEDLEEGQLVDGKVHGKNSYGVWVDIGRSKDARLVVDDSVKYRLKWGEELNGLKVVPCERENALSLELSSEAEKMVRSREDPRAQVTDLKEGASLRGFVTGKNAYGTFLDIGAIKDARLHEQKSIARKLSLGEEVPVVIENVDRIKQVVSVKLVESPSTSTEALF